MSDAQEHTLGDVLGRGPVTILCSCGGVLDRWSLDRKVGQLSQSRKARPSSDLPVRAGHAQAVSYICTTRTCRRRVNFAFEEIESAVVNALRKGRPSVQVGVGLVPRYRGEKVRSLPAAKAPIAGGYFRPWAVGED